MKFEEYARYDAMGLADLVRRKQVSPAELVEAAIARIEEANPRINAVVHRMYEKARTLAKTELPDGPFRGVPFLVKDLDGYLEGEPYTGSSRSLVDFVPTRDCELFVRMKRAGVIIVGKTNTPEFGLLGTTEPELRGPTRNPWNTAHSPGGSSGGSAAAVAARMVPMAHAGDGGGSIRIPAANCGLFGLKPTRARTPVGPEVGEGWSGFVCEGIVSRSVRDTAAMLDATHGPEAGAPYYAPGFDGSYLEESRRAPTRLRIAYSPTSLFGSGIDPECAEAVRDAAKLCASLGHDVEEARPPFDKHALVHAYLVVVAAGTATAVANTERQTGRKPRPEDFEPTTWFLSQVGNALSARELELARATIHAAARRMAPFFDEYDVFLDSTVAYPPVRIGATGLKAWEKAGLAALRAVPPGRAHVLVLNTLAEATLEHTPNTMLFNQTGQPAMSVPLATSATGLPIGLQFVGRFGDEPTLLRLASQLEAARPWAERRPPL